MVVLFIDTCNKELAIGLSIDDKLVYKKEYDAFKRQSEVLAQEIVECFKINNIKSSDVDKVVVTNGPGSYTGLRIGTSVAKGLCYGMNIPLIPVNTLQILCASIPPRLLTSSSPHSLCPMLDARRMEVYTAMYDYKTLQQTTDIIAKVIDAQSFAEELSEISIIEAQPKLEGRTMVMLLAPKK